MDDDFTNKVVVITGGASGIGKAIAEKFQQAKAQIVLFDKDEIKLSAAKQKLPQSLVIQGDVRNIKDLDHLMAATEKAYGKIDILIAAAGIGERRLVDQVDEVFFDEIIDIDFKGVYFTVQRSISRLHQGSSVILISSVASHLTWAAHSVYSSAKAAVSMLVRNFAADLIGRGIRVNGISPGFTNTPIFAPLQNNDPQYFARVLKNVPTGRIADPTEIAEAALFLCSSKAAYIVGVDLVVDGGMSAMKEWV